MWWLGASKGYTLKGSLRCHLINGFSGVRASYSSVICIKYAIIWCAPSLITTFREAFILKWMVCAVNVASTYQENILGSDDSTLNQSYGSPNRMMPWNKRSFQGGKSRIRNEPAFFILRMAFRVSSIHSYLKTLTWTLKNWISKISMFRFEIKY